MAKYGATDDYVPLDNMTERTPLSQTSGGTGTVHIIKEELAEAFDPQKFEKIIPLWADWDDMRVHWRRLARELFAEWFGTMLFVFLGVGSVAASAPFEGRMSSATVVVIALGFGFGITTMIYATANISGGHLNPAVTVAIVAARKMTIVKGLLYMVAQILGSTCGAALVLAALPTEICVAINYGATYLAKNAIWGPHEEYVYEMTVGGGVVVELILTFLLVFCVFATASLPGDEKKMGNFAPQAIGLAVLCGHLVGIPFTGPSMNPARSIGPAIVGGMWDNHWVYWVGPMIGGALASIIYTLILSASAERAKADMKDLAAPQ